MNRLTLENIQSNIKTKIRDMLNIAQSQQTIRQQNVKERCTYCSSKKSRKTTTKCKKVYKENEDIKLHPLCVLHYFNTSNGVCVDQFDSPPPPVKSCATYNTFNT